MATPPVHILHGANLNLLGIREPEIYGTATLADIEAACRTRAATLGLEVVWRQSNHEGELVDWIQEAMDAAGVIINPGAYSHTSVAIHDALMAVRCPTVEVHLSNIHAREPFRRHSYVTAAVRGMICGLGPKGYELALEAVATMRQGGE